MRYLYIVILFATIFGKSDLLAQNDSTENLDALFDDGKTSRGLNNIIKTDLTKLYIGELPFFYERVITNRSSLELGAGLSLGYHNHGIYEKFRRSLEPLTYRRYKDFNDPQLGYSFYFAYKFYMDKAISNAYMANRISYKNFEDKNLDTNCKFVGYHYILGYNFILNRFIIDTSFGWGIEYANKDVLSSSYDDSPIAGSFFLDLKIGLIY